MHPGKPTQLAEQASTVKDKILKLEIYGPTMKPSNLLDFIEKCIKEGRIYPHLLVQGKKHEVIVEYTTANRMVSKINVAITKMDDENYKVRYKREHHSDSIRLGTIHVVSSALKNPTNKSSSVGFSSKLTVITVNKYSLWSRSLAMVTAGIAVVGAAACITNGR